MRLENHARCAGRACKRAGISPQKIESSMDPPDASAAAAGTCLDVVATPPAVVASSGRRHGELMREIALRRCSGTAGHIRRAYGQVARCQQWNQLSSELSAGHVSGDHAATLEAGIRDIDGRFWEELVLRASGR